MQHRYLILALFAVCLGSTVLLGDTPAKSTKASTIQVYLPVAHDARYMLALDIPNNQSQDIVDAPIYIDAILIADDQPSRFSVGSSLKGVSGVPQRKWSVAVFLWATTPKRGGMLNGKVEPQTPVSIPAGHRTLAGVVLPPQLNGSGKWRMQVILQRDSIIYAVSDPFEVDLPSQNKEGNEQNNE